MQPIQHDVVIAGAGPTGLMLAGELALAGVNVALVERRLDAHVAGSRASGLHPRSLEVLDQRGLVERFVAQGTRVQVVAFAGTVLDAADRPSRHNYTLALWQEPIERTLAQWVGELGVPCHRGCALSGFEQDDTGVLIELSGGPPLRAAYLVGCDGGRSLVRKQAGIGFPGWDAQVSYLIFEARMAQEPAWGLRHGPRGVYALAKLEDGARVRGVVTEPRLEAGDEPSAQALQAALQAAYGTDFGVHDIAWLSRFTDAARQATTYRSGRVLLAGDAAHVHSPVGGQGLNIGLQDAVNLGWKLAQVVKGESAEALLDSYHAERHPVGAELLQHTLALTALNRGDAHTTALRALVAQAMQMDAPRRWYTAVMSGLHIRYDLGEGHPLLGRRMPDLDLPTPQGPVRLFTLLHEARPVLLNLGAPGDHPLGAWASRVKRVDATFHGTMELPIVGPVAPPAAVLIRPDGHVAWVDSEGGSSAGLEVALGTWFGRPGP